MFMIQFLLILLLIPIGNMVFAEEDDCIFTAYIEKSWVFFQERPWVTGFVINCDEEIQYHLKDFVYIRILDINGDLVDDNYYDNRDTRRTSAPEKYVFNDSVYRGGGLGGNADTTHAETIYIKENQYFFYMPQIHSIDFEHRGIYQIELKYGDHIRTVWFAVLDPDKRWDEN